MDERDRHLRRAFEDGPIAIGFVGADFRLTDVNAAFCELTGYTAAELATRTISDITHPEDVDGGLALAQGLFAGELPGYSLDKRYVRKDGDVFWAELTVFAINDDDGRPVAALGIVRDVSERHRELTARDRVQAAEAERARWARELHDETLQGLAGLHVLLSSGPGDAQDMRERIRLVQDEIENEMEKLRGLIAELRPAALDELGLAASVRDLAERTQAVYGIEVEAALELDGERLDPEVEVAAYRIVQESLGNAARHAGATRVVIEVERSDGMLAVRVRDDGHGFDPGSRTSGFGLRGMRERVDLLHGRLEIASAGDGGTAVTAELPIAHGSD